MMALRPGGLRMAICRELKPPQEMPNMPMLPFDQGWCASQAMEFDLPDPAECWIR